MVKPGRPGITPEQVVTAADALLLEGQTPTVVAVRKRLGGGSPNTIAPHLAAWKAQREPVRLDTLPVLPESVEATMRQVWSAAWQAAQAQLESERAGLAVARQELERERQEVLGEMERLDATLDEVRAESRRTAEALEGERRAHEQTRGQVREAATLADERQRRIQEQGQEVQEVRRQVAEAASTVARLEADLGHARKGLAAAAADAKREAETRAVAERAAANLRIEVATLTERAAVVGELRDLLHPQEPVVKKKAAAKTGGSGLEGRQT